MALSEQEMREIKHQALGGEPAAEAWNNALNALHAYAQASKCPPGTDVILWFHQRMHAYQDAMSAAFRAGRGDAAVGSA